MTDHRPPRAIGDERETLVALFQYVRDSAVRKLDGVSDEDARRSPVPTGTSLLWLVKHLTRAEALWFLERFAGQPVEPELLDHDVHPDDTVADAVATYRATWARADAVIAGSALDTICAGVDDQSNPDLRWVIAHMLEETARHAGHADILREMLDGQTGR